MTDLSSTPTRARAATAAGPTNPTPPVPLGPPAPVPAAPIAAAAPPTATPRRQPYGVVVRGHGRGGVFDIVVYQDAILVSRASGTDPVVIGALVGAFLASFFGAAVGALLGERIARKSAAKRLPELFYAAPESVFGADRRNRFIRSGDVRFARFVEYRGRRRLLELRMRDGSRCRLTFDVRFESNSFAREALRVSLAPRMRIERERVRIASVIWGATVGAAIILVSVGVVALLVAATS